MNNIAVIGLGYIGLPLAHAFSFKYKVTGFDIDEVRVKELNLAYDRTNELSEMQLNEALSHGVRFTTSIEDIYDCNTYIIAVPTPVDDHKKPNLFPLLRASDLVGSVLRIGDLVIYESTVYPGVTEDDCVPALECASGLVFNKDFYCGYSPERINPGDKQHTITKIVKVTSGSTPEIGQQVDSLYKSIITAGTHLAPSIKVAEAAKVIENTQRDINIAFMNELAIIFNKLQIDTQAVLKAAETKWNFLPFKPGLVGGHCIGVDPYYLTYKAQSMGYQPEITLAGRRLNDQMGVYISNLLVKAMLKKNIIINNAKVLILGLAFKENCPDVRNTKVIDIVDELRSYSINVNVYDPIIDPDRAIEELNINVENRLVENRYDAILIAVPHDDFINMGLEKIKSMGTNNSVIFDLKSAFEPVEGLFQL